jgi:hypothetical protein
LFEQRKVLYIVWLPRRDNLWLSKTAVESLHIMYWVLKSLIKRKNFKLQNTLLRNNLEIGLLRKHVDSIYLVFSFVISYKYNNNNNYNKILGKNYKFFFRKVCIKPEIIYKFWSFCTHTETNEIEQNLRKHHKTTFPFQWRRRTAGCLPYGRGLVTVVLCTAWWRQILHWSHLYDYIVPVCRYLTV